MSFETFVILVVIAYHVTGLRMGIRSAEKNIIKKIMDPIFPNSIAVIVETFVVVGILYLIKYLYNLSI